MPRELLRRLWFLGSLVLGATTACPSGSGTTPREPVARPASWPPEGPGAAEPQPVSEAEPSWLDLDTLAAAGWEPVSLLALPPADGSGPQALVAVRALDGSPGAWLLLEPTCSFAEAPTLRFDAVEPPIPLWPMDGQRRGEWTVVAEQLTGAVGDFVGPLPGAWRIDTRSQPPRVELLWEAFEPADAVAVVDLEGEGNVEIVTLRWHDVCPDPLDLAPAPDCGPPLPGAVEACVDEPPADPCLLLRAWTGGNGVPRTWRTAPLADDRLDSLGDPRLDRLAALLLAVDCRYLDLRAMTVRRETGLSVAGGEGELVEAVGCLEPAAGLAAAETPRLVLLEATGGVRLPVGLELPLHDAAAGIAGSAEPWSRGYRLLPDLDGDGTRDWAWLERSAAGTRYVVTRGPDGPPAGTLFVTADGELVERLVAPPAGGRARLEAIDWRPAPDPAILVDVCLEAPDGSTRTERVALPLEFR